MCLVGTNGILKFELVPTFKNRKNSHKRLDFLTFCKLNSSGNAGPTFPPGSILLALSGGCPWEHSLHILPFAAGPTMPCRLPDINPQCQLLFMVGIVLFSVLPACLVHLVATVDDLIYFFDIPPPLNNKIIFRTNQEMKLIITKV